MKFTEAIVLVVFIVVFKFAESKMSIDQVKNTMKPFKNSCLKKLSMDESLVEGTKRGEFPDDPNLKCFFRCVFNMLKLLKNGEFLVDGLITQIDVMMPDDIVDKMKEMTTNCHALASQKEDLCEVSFEFVKCFYQTEPELYFFP